MAKSADKSRWAERTRTTLSTAWRDLRAHSVLSWSDLTGPRGPLPDRVHFADPVLIGADPAKGAAIQQGRYDFAGDALDLGEGANPWSRPAPGPAWAEVLHSFSWLDDLCAIDDDEAGICARAHVDNWMTASGRWDAIAWTPHITARRVIAWIIHSRTILNGADLVWRSSFLRSLSRQAVHLSNTASWATDGERRMTAAIGLTLSGLCLPHGERRSDRGLALVCEEAARQILPDGGHVSRNPDVLLRIVADLLNLRAAFDHQRLTPPEDLQRVLDRAFPMLRFFRLGDGGFTQVNGAHAAAPDRIDAVLAHDADAGRPLHQANQSGYQRIAQGDAVLIMDTGAPPHGVPGIHAHAGCLAFELSIGAQRVIVNCGAAHDLGPDWRTALRSTAAHSTVTLADTSSCTFLPRDPDAAFADGRVLAGPRSVMSERRETPEGVVVEASHDGYERRFGMLHSRRVFLNQTGREVRGEDTVISTDAKAVKAREFGYHARFHLHADIQADLTDEGKRIMLTLPDASVWRFKVNGGTMALETSTYVDGTGSVRPARQIVVHGEIGPEPTVLTWSFTADKVDAGEETWAGPEAIPTEKGPAVERPKKAKARKSKRVNTATDNPAAELGLDDWPPVRIEDIKVLED